VKLQRIQTKEINDNLTMKKLFLSSLLTIMGLFAATNVMAEEIEYEQKFFTDFSDSAHFEGDSVTFEYLNDQNYLKQTAMSFYGKYVEKGCRAVFNISQYTAGATNVKIEFDCFFFIESSKNNSYQMAISIRDSKIPSTHTTNAYSSTGAFCSIGHLGQPKDKYIAVDSVRVNGDMCHQVLHVTMEIDLTNKTNTCNVTHADSTVYSATKGYFDSKSDLTEVNEIEFFSYVKNNKARLTNLSISTGTVVESPTSVAVTTAKQFVTYSNSKYALDFSNTKEIGAYSAAVKDDGTAVILAQADTVPAGSGVILYTPNGSATEEVPIITDCAITEIAGNELIAVTDTSTIYSDKVNETASEGEGCNYILQDGVFKKANSESGNPLAAGKAYLRSSKVTVNEAKSLNFAFGGTTGIEELNGAKQNTVGIGKIYNLQGVEIQKPARGLYISNGRKIIVE